MLAQIPTKGYTPYRGAYCMHINQAIGTSTTAAVVTETGDFDTAAAGTIHVAFAFMADQLTMAASDVVTIFSLDAAGPTSEAEVQLFNNAGTIELRGGDGTTFRATNFTQNRWYWIEMSCLIDSGVPNDGTIDFYVDGSQIGAQITGTDQGAITQARWGAHTITGVAAGHLFYDQLMADDARIGFYYPRYPQQYTYTKSSHVFVGPGVVSRLTLVSTTAGNIVRLFDTDTAYVTAQQIAAVELAIGAALSMEVPTYFERGCYLELTGTNPRAQIALDRNAGPIAYSDAGMKLYAHNRRARSGNV